GTALPQRDRPLSARSSPPHAARRFLAGQTATPAHRPRLAGGTGAAGLGFAFAAHLHHGLAPAVLLAHPPASVRRAVPRLRRIPGERERQPPGIDACG